MFRRIDRYTQTPQSFVPYTPSHKTKTSRESESESRGQSRALVSRRNVRVLFRSRHPWTKRVSSTLVSRAHFTSTPIPRSIPKRSCDSYYTYSLAFSSRFSLQDRYLPFGQTFVSTHYNMRLTPYRTSDPALLVVLWHFIPVRLEVSSIMSNFY